MKLRLRRQPNGVALIIVMIAILVLSGMAAILSYSMRVEAQLAHNSTSNQELVWLGRSGVEYARWVLAQEASIPGEPYDSLNQFWSSGQCNPGESNSVLSGLSLNNYPVGDGTVSLKIIDLERYANINTADSAELHQALTLMGVDADSISVVSDSIQDWVQPGDMPRVAGAKSDYYQGFNPPYNCKEAPIDDMSELLLVRGIWDHPEIYWGGSATNHQPAAFQHHQLGFGAAPGQIPDYPFGLKDLFTPFSTGRININTADENVLQLIPGVDANVAEELLKLRAGPDGADGTDDDTPFANAGAALQSAGDANPQAANFATVRSSTFQVTVSAKLGDYTRDYKAILYRNGRNVEVVSFYWQK
jgi:general secretion pathway protein K